MTDKSISDWEAWCIQPNPNRKKRPSFEELCKNLGIEDYCEAIFYSNSRGELYHIGWYYDMWQVVKKHPNNKKVFREIFDLAVDHANKTWGRPQSVFQHMDKMFSGSLGLTDQGT